jgi:hypothetical protein
VVTSPGSTARSTPLGSRRRWLRRMSRKSANKVLARTEATTHFRV